MCSTRRSKPWIVKSQLVKSAKRKGPVRDRRLSLLTGSLETITDWHISGALTSKCFSHLLTSSLELSGQAENSLGYAQGHQKHNKWDLVMLSEASVKKPTYILTLLVSIAVV